MRERITKAQAMAFRARWRAVNAAEREELRATPPAVKLRQLAALMASTDALGWAEPMRAEEAEARARWTRVRRALNG